MPFEIPDSWEWCRLNTICQLIDGEKIAGEQYNNLDARYMRGKGEPKIVDSGKFVKKHTRLILVDGENSGEVFIAPEDGYMGSTFKVLWISASVFSDYVLHLIEMHRMTLKHSKKGAAIPHLNKEMFFNLFIPLPPLSEQHRIVAKIEELLPHIENYTEVETKLNALNATFLSQLKKSILQQAVQGKLVPQNPDDEPASVLLERIRAEKQELIKTGKIKKDKNESVIVTRDKIPYEIIDGKERCIADEVPFEIPENWCWCRLGNVCKNIQYGTSQKSSETGKMPVLRMGNLQNGKIDYEKLVYTSDDEEIKRYPLSYNDLLFNRTNSREIVGKTAIYKAEMPAIYAGYLVRITPLIDSDYLNFVMQSQYYWIYCQSVRSDAIGQSNINAEKLKHFLIPLPPLSEQYRIVEKIEELIKVCEKL